MPQMLTQAAGIDHRPDGGQWLDAGGT